MDLDLDIFVGRLSSVLGDGPQANLFKVSSMMMRATVAMMHISCIFKSGMTETRSSLGRSATSFSSIQCKCLLFVPTVGDLADMIYRRGAGAKALATTSRVTEEAMVRAQQELEGRTGDTDSEEDE